MTVIRQTCLDNGLEISFNDASNRYYGDYHRICVVVTISYSLDRLTDEELRQHAAAIHGERFKVEKRLARMGVASADFEQVRNTLINDFPREKFIRIPLPIQIKGRINTGKA
jgi:hypothetical protein